MGKTKPVLKLSGCDGNVFSVLGKARQAAQGAGWDEEQIKAFFELAVAGNYDEVIQLCMKYFEVE